MATHLRIGLFGAGIVGGGVIDLVQRLNLSSKLSSIGASMEIAKVCVQDIPKKRDFVLESQTILVSDPNEILDDESINCIVEVIGGVGLAKDVVMRALGSGKFVVTANKALIAAQMNEIEQLLQSNPRGRLMYEAAVCGGIPIINILQTDFLCDHVTSIRGIMNGTTNFILSQMEDIGLGYDEALARAQQLGFAEADPTADVDGFDVMAKIMILSKLVFGITIPSAEHVVRSGIRAVTAEDFNYAKSIGCTIKLIGSAELNLDGSSIAVLVLPTFVPRENPLGKISGPGNAVIINSENRSNSMFFGPGAGRYPTANAVVSDLIRLSQGTSPQRPFPLPPSDTINRVDSGCYRSRYCIRFCGSVLEGIEKSSVDGIAIEHTIAVREIIQQAEDKSTWTVITEIISFDQAKSFCASLARQFNLQGSPTLYAIIS